MEYLNLAAVLWLSFMTISTMYMANANIGNRIKGISIFPFVLSIVSLVILGITAVEGVL